MELFTTKSAGGHFHSGLSSGRSQYTEPFVLNGHLMLFNRAILYGLLVSGVSLHLRAADESPVTAFMNEPRVVLHQWSPERARQKLVCDTLVESLCRRDQFVWLYFEEQNLLSGKTGDWHSAVLLKIWGSG